MKIRFLLVAGFVVSITAFPQIASSATVHIHGVSMDSTVTYLKITRPVHLWANYNTEPFAAEAIRNGNSNAFDLSFELDRPVQLWIESPNETWPIFCTPGDDVSFVISRNPHDKRYLIIKFDGQNSAQYNIINDLQYLGFRFSYPVFRGDPLAYRSAVDAWLGEKEKLFDNYKNQFQTNTAFLDYFTSTIAYGRLNLLYAPLWNEKISLADLPAGYFAGTQSLSFSDEFLLDISDFRGALVSKYVYAFGSSIWDNFDERYKMVTSLKPGKIREYLYACLIGIYARHESPQYETRLNKAMQDASQFVKAPEYLEFIAETRKNYLLLNHVFTDSIQSNTFLLSAGDNKKITMKEMMTSFSGQAIYFDFWAQSCVPCRQNIRESKQAKDLLMKEKIMYVYISIDTEKDLEKWKEASRSDGITDNQYLLINGKDSPLGKYLQVGYIPRYILIDESHALKKSFAPRPVVNQLPALVRSIKEMRTNDVTHK